MATPKKRSTTAEEAEMTPEKIQELFAPRTEIEIIADRLTPIAQKQIKVSVEYKQPRMQDVQKRIDLYNGKTKKALKGRWNVPLPVMSGYIDTLLSKTDDAPKVKYGYTDIADLDRSKKVQAKFDQESTNVEAQWALKDRQEKKLASFYGMGISKKFAYNDANGEFVDVYEVVDPLDFECEPMGGQILSNHKFKGQRNIFKTKTDLLKGAQGDDAVYNKKQVLQLVWRWASRDTKEIEKLYIEKTERLRALGFAPDTHSYVGIPMYAMTEWYMEDPETGDWYYLLLEPHTGIWVRCEKLVDMFESGMDPFTAWHTHPDPFNFWSKSPADDMYPVADAMNIIFNQALDNREKRNYTQRAYDPEIFPDPSQLEWRPDGLVEATTNSGERTIASGIYEFKVDDMPESGTINLMEFMDNLSGLKTGVTSSAQGESDEKRVGIYFGNLQQTADRLGLYNKSYSEAWGRKGLLFYHGLREHIRSNKMMVRMIGSEGYDWVELIKDDLFPKRDFNIEIVGGNAQEQLDEFLKKTKSDSLKSITTNPNLASRLNPDVTIEETLRAGGWDEVAIKRFLNTKSYGSEEMISEAHQAIQEILAGKKPKVNRGADVVFVETIMDFAYDSEDLKDADFEEIVAYGNVHMDIALENAMRKARLEGTLLATQATLQGLGGPQPGERVSTGGGGSSIPTPGSEVNPEAIPTNTSEAKKAAESRTMVGLPA